MEGRRGASARPPIFWFRTARGAITVLSFARSEQAECAHSTALDYRDG